VQALWTLDGIGALDPNAVLPALSHSSPIVRAAGARLSERFLAGNDRDELIKRLLVVAKDTSTEVQLQALLTLGGVADPKVDLALAEIVRAYPQNTFLRDALFSGLANRELALLEQLNAKSTWNDEDADKIVSGLARGVFGSRQLPDIERVISLAAKAAASGASKRALALLEALVPTTGSSRRPLQFARQPEGWAELENLPAAKTRLARLKDVIVWPGKPGVAAIAVVKPLTADQQARFETGKALFNAVCAACHQTTGRGLDGLAPPLVDSEWVLETVERPVRIVLHGVRGSIRVLGKTHTGDMPAFGAALDDQQISSILTYIRREWGHTASPIEPGQVKAIRAATASHTDAWSPEELMQVK
jgi:mono/diheme cytochrome c family protein